jgi:hypothetical protein
MGIQEYNRDEEVPHELKQEWELDMYQSTAAGVANSQHDDESGSLEALHAAALDFSDNVHALVSASKGGDEITIPHSWKEAMRNPTRWLPPMQK